jgi:glycosyltransferase involved in cell wall biosynthesis
MKKKIMFVIRSLSGGGAERVMSNLANHFSSMGYKVTLVCLDEQEMRYQLAPEITVKSLVKRKKSNNVFFRVYYALETFAKLFDTIRRVQPHCCVSFMTSVNFWTGLCCLLLNKEYIVSERTSPYHTIGKLNVLSQVLVYQIYKRAKAVVLPSVKMITAMKSLRFFNDLTNLSTVYNPVNQFDTPLGFADSARPFLLGVGRLHHDKGFDILLDAFAEVKNRNVDLLLSGIGPNKEMLQKKAVDLGLESRVKFIGFNKNLQDYYFKATIFVLSSRVEGYPNALVEAMSMGTAVISTDCEFGPSEIIQHGVNGLLVEVESKTALTKAIDDLLDNEQLRQTLSNNAKQINETNSIENIAEKWNNLILS